MPKQVSNVASDDYLTAIYRLHHDEGQDVIAVRLADRLEITPPSVAGMLNEGKQVEVEAALVKELGNNFEKLLPELTRLAAPADRVANSAWRRAYEVTQLLSPSFTLRGGTREILRGVIARGLGLR